jgi:hypothetical protein
MPRRDLFTGRSGQLALMAEFLQREMNVAIPEVDIGDDIVVVRDDNDQITRVQVKTATAIPLQTPDGFTAQFSLPLEQLEHGPLHLVYAFVVRHNDRWEFVIMPRSILFQLHTVNGLGSVDPKKNLVLKLSFRPDAILNKGLNLNPFRSRFDPWPPSEVMPEGVIPPADVE